MTCLSFLVLAVLDPVYLSGAGLRFWLRHVVPCGVSGQSGAASRQYRTRTGAVGHPLIATQRCLIEVDKGGGERRPDSRLAIRRFVI
jgi:hypothetical protein